MLLPELGLAYDIEIAELAIALDHVHLYCSFPPRMAISEAVGKLKSLSARAVFREIPQVKRQLWGGAFWEDGYFARTVGDKVAADMIRRYIKRHDDLPPPWTQEPDSGQLELF